MAYDDLVKDSRMCYIVLGIKDRREMGITKVQIRNYKSIKNISFCFGQGGHVMHCLIGKNGAGKSNFIDAICYFYSMLGGKGTSQDIMDSNNIYVQSCEIEVEYDFGEIIINKSNPYYDEKMKELEDFLQDWKIHVRMVQYRDGTVQWYPGDMSPSMRKLLYKLFPVFCVDTRFISLQDWNGLWEIISDLSVGHLKMENEMMEKEMDAIFTQGYGDKYVKTITLLKEIFGMEGIKVNADDYRSKYKNAIMMRLGGNEFLSDENRLSYYSDGANSFKYIRLVVELITGLSNTGWKNPLLLIDEPEIGLHVQYMRDLVGCFWENRSSKVNILLSSHSPYLISELVKSEMRINLWRVYYSNHCTMIEKIKDILDEKQKFLISDTETSCYFARALLFVEGKSEIQLLNNKRIVELYPELRQITIMRYDSDNSSLKLVYPDFMNFSIPYFTMVDMDKIISYSYKKHKFKIKSDSLVNPLFNPHVLRKQQFTVYNDNLRRRHTYDAGRQIRKRLSEEEFFQDASHFYIADDSFDKLLGEIKRYCYEYRVIPVTTTVEGMIVSERNVEIAIKWMEEMLEENGRRKLQELLTLEPKKNTKYRTTIARCILNGKMDNLCGMGDNGVQIDDKIKSKVKYLNNQLGGKVSGWIGEFLDYYFQYKITVKKDNEKKKKEFERDFPELSFILHESIKMIQ